MATSRWARFASAARRFPRRTMRRWNACYASGRSATTPCSPARRPRSSILGDPTEGALVVAAAKAGLRKEQLELAWPRLNEIPFQSERQWMATLHSNSGKRVLFVKGAPERVLAMSASVARTGGSDPLDEAARQTILGAVERMAGDAMRVMALACCDYGGQPGDLSEESLRGRLTFLGLAGMSDPPRAEARAALRQCQEAGIRAVMITGDNPATAAAVARGIGLPEGRPVTGAEIGRMSDAELDAAVRGASVFARIEPLHKLRIVQAFKRQGEVVAMTGDGVNDAPALETADIGIAMGITGTDVAKEAADMVLADDNFASILAAVEEGRSIFNRLRNVTFFLLTTCFGELLALMLCVFFLGVAPLVPLQILWINLLTGSIMAIPLGLEPRTGLELRQTPRDPRVGLLYPGLLLRSGFLAALLGIGVTLLFGWTLRHFDLREARTAAFSAVVVFEWLVAFNARSDELTIFRLGVVRNRPLLLALAIAVPLQCGRGPPAVYAWAVQHRADARVRMGHGDDPGRRHVRGRDAAQDACPAPVLARQVEAGPLDQKPRIDRGEAFTRSVPMKPPRTASIPNRAGPDIPNTSLETRGSPVWTWYSEGDMLFADMLAAVAVARLSVRLETYIFEAAGIGIRMRDSLAAAARRGVRVRVLVDGFGSSALPTDFWDPLREAGGDARVFNPLRLDRLGIRDHRKLLVCDDEVAFVGGYNIAPNYEGDGVQQGWRDVALRVAGPLAAALGATFDRMYAVAAFRRKSFVRLRRAEEKRICGRLRLRSHSQRPGAGRKSFGTGAATRPGRRTVRANHGCVFPADSATVARPDARGAPGRRGGTDSSGQVGRGAFKTGDGEPLPAPVAGRCARVRIPAPDASRQTVHHR